jgi:hypothetical protein
VHLRADSNSYPGRAEMALGESLKASGFHAQNIAKSNLAMTQKKYPENFSKGIGLKLVCFKMN